MSRQVLYKRDDGEFDADRSWRHEVEPLNVAETWKRLSSRIPARFAVAEAETESNFCVNERDIEPDGFTTDGIFQVSRREAIKALRPLADLHTLEENAAVYATICEGNLDAIIEAATEAFNAGKGKYPLDGAGSPIPDVWGYLSMAHNQGMGGRSGKGIRPSILRHGLDFDAYEARNAGMPIAVHIPRGRRAMSGGSKWDPAWEALPEPEEAPSTGFGPRALLLVLFIGLLAFAGYSYALRGRFA